MNKQNFKNYTAFGTWVKHFCIDQGISASDLGFALGIGKSMFLEMCKGRKQIASNVREKLIEKFGLDGEKLDQLDETLKKDPSLILNRLRFLAFKLDEDDINTLNNIINKHGGK